MNKHISIIIIITFLSFSCKHFNENIDNENIDTFHINVIDSLNNNVNEFLLSDVAKDIDIIPLKINDNFLYKKIHKILIGKNDIFINADRFVLRYDKNGNFIQSISSTGQGPKDYLYPLGIGIDDTRLIIYVFCAHENVIKSYSYTGIFIETKQIAQKGAHLSGSSHSESRIYTFFDNLHLFRRMLPVSDGSNDLWLIGLWDINLQKISTFTDPVNNTYQNEFNKYRPDGKLLMPHYWSESSPVLNRYNNNINFLFQGNDTIYQYFIDENILIPRFSLYCGERPSFRSIRKAHKEWSFFPYIIVSDILETMDYIFFTVEKNEYAHLMRFNKNNRSITVIREKGKIRESELMGIRFRDASPPGFTNDLCGGLPFYPDHQDSKTWVARYDPTVLLEKIDIEKLNNENVKFPHKKIELINILKTIKPEDEQVLMIVTLK